MTSTVSIKTTQKFWLNQNTALTDKIVNAFVQSCIQLDASIFEPFMNEEDVFEDVEKYSFLAVMHRMFDDLRRFTMDDFYVEVKDTTCKSCFVGKSVKHFEVFNGATKQYEADFAYLIDIEKGVLKDIYKCYEYVGCKTCTIGGNDGVPELTISLPLYNKEFRNMW